MNDGRRRAFFGILEYYSSAMRPVTRDAKSGDVSIAYQVVGTGVIDLVLILGWISHLEYAWELPSFAHFIERLASFCRVIWLDKQGTGLSDRVAINDLPTLEQRMDDLRARLWMRPARNAPRCSASPRGARWRRSSPPPTRLERPPWCSMAPTPG